MATKTKAKAKPVAAPKPPKLSASSGPRKKSELFTVIGAHTGLARKQVAGVFEVLGKVIAVDLAKPSAGKNKVSSSPGCDEDHGDSQARDEGDAEAQSLQAG